MALRRSPYDRGIAALAGLHFGWGVAGVWAGLDALILVRALTCGWRFSGSRRALTGA